MNTNDSEKLTASTLRQNKPTTGQEWTARQIAKCYDIDSITATRLAFDINAALDAERERIKVLESGTGLNAVIETNKQLREQLSFAKATESKLAAAQAALRACQVEGYK